MMVLVNHGSIAVTSTYLSPLHLIVTEYNSFILLNIVFDTHYYTTVDGAPLWNSDAW